nr:MAG TPA: hypothetical protein [Bacteriophage sp.]
MDYSSSWTTHVAFNHGTKVGNKSHQTNLRAVSPFLQIKLTNELYLHAGTWGHCNYLIH